MSQTFRVLSLLPLTSSLLSADHATWYTDATWPRRDVRYLEGGGDARPVRIVRPQHHRVEHCCTAGILLRDRLTFQCVRPKFWWTCRMKRRRWAWCLGRRGLRWRERCGQSSWPGASCLLQGSTGTWWSRQSPTPNARELNPVARQRGWGGWRKRSVRVCSTHDLPWLYCIFAKLSPSLLPLK